MKRKITKRKITKWMAGISSVAMLASFSALSVPAFAAEYEAMEAESYVASFANEKAQKVAKYLLDSGVSLEEAAEMMDWYMDGLTIIEGEQNANSGIATASVSTGKAYYSGTAKASTQHYGAIIIDNPEANVKGVLYVEGVFSNNNGTTYYPTFENVEVENEGVNLNGYDNCSIAMDTTNSVSYTIRTNTNTAGTPLAMCKFPIDSVSVFSSEAAIHNATSLDASLVSTYSGGNKKSTTFEFHTYALGDFDHNGVVDNADYDYIVDFCMLSFDGKFNYTDITEETAYQVNRLAADANKDGTITIQDAIAVGKIVNG